MILFKAGEPVKTVIGAYPKRKLQQELEPSLTAAPDTAASEAAAPDTAASEAVAPEAVAPESVAPESVAPEAAPEPAA
jgi:thioredoxin-like negative regulator of GroEL